MLGCSDDRSCSTHVTFMIDHDRSFVNI